MHAQLAQQLGALLVHQAGQGRLLEGVPELFTEADRVRELLEKEAVLLNAFDAECVRGGTDSDDKLVVWYFEAPDLAVLCAGAYDVLAHHRLRIDVDRHRLRLKVSRLRVGIPNRLNDRAWLKRTERGAGEHWGEEEVVSWRDYCHITMRRIFQLREDGVGAPAGA